jgi:hypothetical protein
MKSMRLMSITAMTFFATLAIPVRMATQGKNQQAPHYTRKQPPDNRQLKVGDCILVSLSAGRVEEAHPLPQNWFFTILNNPYLVW